MKFLHKELGEITVMMEADVDGRKYSMVSSDRSFRLIRSRYGFRWRPEFYDQSRWMRNGKPRLTQTIYILWGNTDDLNDRGITKLGRSDNKTLGKKFMKIIEASKYMEFTKRVDSKRK